MNRYLEKIAQLVSPETKRDVVNTGVIAGLGAVGNAISDRILHPGVKGNFGRAAMIGGGIGLAADYAGIKLNKKINEHIK